MTVPDGVSLSSSLNTARGDHARLRLVLVTLFGTYHSTELVMKEMNTELMDRETNIEEYNPLDQGFKSRLPESIAH